ncbi:NAD(P)-dependent oxidoreductase [Actinomadura kijaniata]|uniref:NAD(P)-binding domain-containing protein n=1 Tax=Actinomadura namibiensis TaxID=182080 RepID=A0A7W3LU31_ACTNM|nr:NAD(P)H-binding protein [Actinomadura namibiensis]MBA8954306.1 hypothetical protein [Actinomadura namibiensis]
MSRIVIFGAGGRGGRAAVAEARRRGHEVTAVVRDPAAHPGLDAHVIAGDVTDPASVAAASRGHDAAINSTYAADADPAAFFPAAARALLTGLAAPRLVSVGLASVIPAASGELLMDTPGYPQEHRAFLLAHQAGDEVFQKADTDLDWLVISPSGDFDHEGTPTGRYRLAPGDAASRITYADFALALLDEIETPRHHRTHIGVEA